MFPGSRGIEIGLEELLEAVGRKNFIVEFRQDDPIQPVHWHPQPCARRATFLQLLGAAVIAIATALAGILDKRRSTGATAGEPCQESRAVGEARWQAFGIPALQQSLNGVELLLIDDSGDSQFDPFRRRPQGTAAAVASIEVVRSVIAGRSQDVVDAAGREPVSGDPINQVDPTGAVGEQALSRGCTGGAAPACAAALSAGVVVCMISPECRGWLGNNWQRLVTSTVSWTEESGAPTVPLPDQPVGDNPQPGRTGGRLVSGPLTPENGGTGDPEKDFDVLTGGTGKPNDSGGRPAGTKIGDNAVQLRPGIKGNGPRIDIPANGDKLPETLHCPPPAAPPPPTKRSAGA